MDGLPLTPRPVLDLDLSAFFQRVRHAPVRVLMLDFDGTLAPFDADPASVAPYPTVITVLDDIMTHGHTRLVIVSGRWTCDLVPRLGLRRRPEVWGSHGWERLMPDSAYDPPSVGAGVLDRLAAAAEWAATVTPFGARIERKPTSIAFHWRGLPAAATAAIRDAVAARWRAMPSTDGLRWHEFDGGIELRSDGRDKGDVVRALVGEAGADAALAYLGDDLTDEDAFRALPAHGAAVLVRPVLRPTAANHWLDSPQALVAFLRRWDTAAHAG